MDISTIALSPNRKKCELASDDSSDYESERMRSSTAVQRSPLSVSVCSYAIVCVIRMGILMLIAFMKNKVLGTRTVCAINSALSLMNFRPNMVKVPY